MDNIEYYEELQRQYERGEKVGKVVNAISNHVNSGGARPDELKTFVRLMESEHRTLQQSFTRLCVAWLEHCASDGYRTDLRNEQSKVVARQMLKDAETYLPYV